MRRPVLWVRPLDTDAGRPLAGTVALESPFWSADSRLLGFFADGRLKTIDVDSERIETLTDVGRPRGGAWNDGRRHPLLDSDTGLDRIDAGRQPAPARDRARHEAAASTSTGGRSSCPDGRRFLYVVRSNVEDQAGVYIGSLDSPIKQQADAGVFARRLLSDGSSAVRSARNADGAVVRRAVGPLSGEPQAHRRPIKFHTGNDAAFDVSNDGC